MGALREGCAQGGAMNKDLDDDVPKRLAASSQSDERRRSFRVRVTAQAGIFHNGELLGHYPIRDLSTGGCLLSNVDAQRAVGERVEVLLHLPRHTSVGVSALVTRHMDDVMALSFEHATPRAEDCIQDLVLQAFIALRAHGEDFVALVIEPDASVRAQLLEQLNALGQPAIGVATALDAVQILMEQAERVDCALIQSRSLHVPSNEIVEFLSQHHPHTRRVLIGDAREVTEAWQRSAPDLVHSMLELPASDRMLEQVLSRVRGISAALPVS